MPQNLKDIELDEVSLVDKGANQHAHVVLMKSLSKDFPEAADAIGKAISFREAMNNDIASDKLGEMMEGFHRSIGSIMADESITNKSAAVAESAAQFHAAVAALSKEYEMSDNSEELMQKVAKLEADLATAEETNAKLTADLEAATSPEPEAADEVNKADLPESVRKALDEAEELKKRADEQAERIQKMEDAAAKKSWIEKSADSDTGTLMHQIAKHDGELADKAFELVSAMRKRAEEAGLFKSIGSDGDADAETAVDKVNKKASEYAEKNGVSHSVAVSKVLEANPSLYEEYRNEQH